MPELPEVEITARLIGDAVAGARVESALAPGINALKTFDPPLSAIEGREIAGIRRRGKLFVVELEDDLTLLVHLMSAGRLQLFDTRASLRDRTSRLLVRLADGRELRLREFGTKQRAWVKLLRAGEVDEEETIAALGPEAWPDPPPLEELLVAAAPAARVAARPARDRRHRPLVGRRDPARGELSPFKRGEDLGRRRGAGGCARRSCAALGGAIEHYEETLSLPIPDKLPMPLTVHRRNGEPCPRCGDRLEAVFYEDYVMCYCPTCQTEGKLLKDRRLSRLLK